MVTILLILVLPIALFVLNIITSRVVFLAFAFCSLCLLAETNDDLAHSDNVLNSVYIVSQRQPFLLLRNGGSNSAEKNCKT